MPDTVATPAGPEGLATGPGGPAPGPGGLATGPEGLATGPEGLAYDPGGLATGPDGRPRCAWAIATADYVAYHDDEWGRAVHGERELFERITLEAFQSGLSWLTILRKREAFRRAFAGFDAERVAAFGPDDVARLLADSAIVRNRAKIAAAVTNARAVVSLREAAPGGLDGLVWAHAPARRPRPRRLGDVQATTPESTALAKALRRHGFVFVGPTTAYATMQACGLVDDHLEGCWVPTQGM